MAFAHDRARRRGGDLLGRLDQLFSVQLAVDGFLPPMIMDRVVGRIGLPSVRGPLTDGCSAWIATCAWSCPAAVEKEPHGGAQPPFLLGRRLAADQERDALGQADDDDEELLGAHPGIAELDRAAIRIDAQDLHDLVETVPAAALGS